MAIRWLGRKEETVAKRLHTIASAIMFHEARQNEILRTSGPQKKSETANSTGAMVENPAPIP